VDLSLGEALRQLLTMLVRAFDAAEIRRARRR
jgi:hypothetical protein